MPLNLFGKKKDGTRKKFVDTKVGAFIKEKAPHIIDELDDAFPKLKLLTALIKKTPDEQLSPELKAQILEMAKFELDEQKEITTRWTADMSSDSWLSKNARPIILLYSWFLYTVMVVVGFFGVTIPKEYVYMTKELFLLVNGAYFGGRMFEKISAMRSKRLSKGN